MTTATTVFTDIKSTWAGFMSNTFSNYITTDEITDIPGVSAFAEFLSDKNGFHVDTEGIDAFMQQIDTIAKTPTKRTVYMDSNIALTDGRKHAKDDTARIIPNLFDTIEGLRVGEEILAHKVDAISSSHGPSTADAGLFVRQYTPVSDPYQAFLREPVEDSKPSIEIIAGNKLTDIKPDGNATNGSDAFAYNMHFKANEITFTVSNPNAVIPVAYQISDLITSEMFVDFDVHPIAAEMINAWGLVGDVYYSCLDSIKYYFVPLEDNEKITNNITEDDTNGYTIAKGVHGKVFMNIPYKENMNFGHVESAFKGVTDDTSKQSAAKIYGLMKKNGTCVYLSHAVLADDLKASNKKENTLGVTGEMTYNLGAIIEAIQELNRRTMFMDIDMSFNGAMSYGDYVAEFVTAGAYGKVLDGLPAATDTNIGKHYG